MTNEEIESALRGGCYAESGSVSWLWANLTSAGPNAEFKNGRSTLHSTDWQGLCSSVSALPFEQLWRHNQAGDMPHNNEEIDAEMLFALVEANRGKRGFTYTHHDPRIGRNAELIRFANQNGFTINLSANTLAHADTLADLDIGPVAVVLPAEIHGNVKLATPAGRKVVVCPATYRDDVQCATCALCQHQRTAIVGFPAHGARKRVASAIADDSVAARVSELQRRANKRTT
jgi:hypothetical protein